MNNLNDSAVVNGVFKTRIDLIWNITVLEGDRL